MANSMNKGQNEFGTAINITKSKEAGKVRIKEGSSSEPAARKHK